MTDRIIIPTPWGDGGERLDPDVDNGNENWVEGKYELGSKYHKPVHEWDNFFLNGTDASAFVHMEEFNLWDSEITYEVGALVTYEGSAYRCLVTHTNYTPDIHVNIWEEILGWGTAYDEYQDAVNADNDKVYAHEADYSDPHEVTPAQADTYSDTEQIGLFDPYINIEHIDDTTDPHEVTPAQLGTMPSTGGEFDGTVGMLRGKFGDGVIELATSGLGLRKGTGLYISESLPKVNTAEAFTRDSFKRLHTNSQPLFSVDVPDLWMPLKNGVYLATSLSPSDPDAEYTCPTAIPFTNRSGTASEGAANVEPIEAAGLLISGTDQSITFSTNVGNPNSTVYGVVDGVPTAFEADMSSVTNLLDLFNLSDGQHLSDIRIWSYVLTTSQLTSLGVIA